MKPELVYRPITPDEPIGPIARLAGLAFGHPESTNIEWFEKRIGRENIRISTATDDPTPLGVVCRIPMGIYLGGNEIPQLGILGVGVAPEARGLGVAKQMMADCVQEMHADGCPLSILYSAMHPLYRAVGYDNAGALCNAVIPAGMITAPKTNATNNWREASEIDTPQIHACYARYAAQTHGMLARNGYIWQRIREPKIGTARCYVSRDEQGQIEAYCYYVQEKTEAQPAPIGTAAGSRMHVTDLAWSSTNGFNQIRSFLRGFVSVVGEILVNLPPDSPLIHTLPDRRFKLEFNEPWMLRILNFKSALEARSYPRGYNATLTLDITDDQIQANNGQWTVTITNGQATVSQGQSGDPLRIHIRDLAPLYTGFTSAQTLRDSGRLSCTDNTAETANAIFAAPSTPAMVDMF